MEILSFYQVSMLGDSVNISIQFDTFSYSSFHSNINQAIIMGGLLIEAICKRESTKKKHNVG